MESGLWGGGGYWRGAFIGGFTVFAVFQEPGASAHVMSIMQDRYDIRPPAIEHYLER